jgi:hypothetical protein
MFHEKLLKTNMSKEFDQSSKIVILEYGGIIENFNV